MTREKESLLLPLLLFQRCWWLWQPSVACAWLCQASFRTPAGYFLPLAAQKLWDWEMVPVIVASCHSKAEIALHL